MKIASNRSPAVLRLLIIGYLFNRAVLLQVAEAVWINTIEQNLLSVSGRAGR